MRWSEYVASHPPEAMDALVNNLTAGYGGLTFMVRLLSRNGELATVLDGLDRAERALDHAYRALDLDPQRVVLTAAEPVTMGQPWQAYLQAFPADGGPALLARLQDVVEQARVAGEVIGADGSVEEIDIALRATLDHLQGLRREMTER